ncbi:Uncharacterised protein [uncultured Clostridium sp.]|uniref:hypothetical protein n=1 Tax=uncultured Clostridium sp. TaxID=59620 RepID=UPI000821C7DB|nr:hypothetical protein [uncultured Clostridium sp.]SCK03221.1 Uncharacterised protein [uncultured Clostridium sp.]
MFNYRDTLDVDYCACSDLSDYSSYDDYEDGCNSCEEILNSNITSDCTNNSNFNVDLRTELIIKESPQTICNVLQELCNQNIKIDGFEIQAICEHCSVFRFVVGAADCQKLTDVQVAKSILSTLDISYMEDAIFKVSSRRTTIATLPSLYCELQRNVTVNASYPSLTKGLYFQADPIDEALNTLKVSNCAKCTR